MDSFEIKNVNDDIDIEDEEPATIEPDPVTPLNEFDDFQRDIPLVSLPLESEIEQYEDFLENQLWGR